MIGTPIRLKSNKNGGRAQREYLKAAEYYAPGQGMELGLGSRFCGSGAEALGLTKDQGRDLDFGAFERICEGRHPITGEMLVRGDPDEHAAGVDFTTTAPKSFSALLGVLYTADPEEAEKLNAEEEAAFDVMLAYAEKRGLFVGRVGHGGTETVKVKPVVARFSHAESRTKDSQKHGHNVICNIGQTEDGRWLCLETKPLFEARMELSTVYQLALAERLKARGYDLQTREISPEKGREAGLVSEIVGVPKKLIDICSKRTREMKAWVDEQNEKNGTKLDFKDHGVRDLAARSSRKWKDKSSADLQNSALRKAWADEAIREGVFDETLAGIAGRKSGKVGVVVNAETFDAANAAERVERVMIDGGGARLSESSLRYQALIDAQAAGMSLAESIEKADEFPERFFIRGATAKTGSRWFASPVVVGMERKALDYVRNSMGLKAGVREKHIQSGLDAFAKKTGVDLRSAGQEESLAAIRELCADGGARVVVGAAGTGKTFIVDAFKACLDAEGKGRKIYGTAVSSIAAQGLDGAVEAQANIAKLSLELERGKIKLGKGDVVVLDEAGMASSCQFALLAEHCERAGAALRIIGDMEQIQAVGLPSLMDEIADITGSAILQTVRRQRDKADAQAGLDVRNGEGAKAVEHYKKTGAYRVVGDTVKDAAQAAAKWYLEETAGTPLEKKRLGAATRDVTRQTNEAVRLERVRRGEIAEGVPLPDFEGMESKLAAGERIAFKKPTKKAHELEVQMPDGKWEKAASNRKAPVKGILNGEFGTVLSVVPVDADAHMVTVRLDSKKGPGHVVRFRSDLYDRWLQGNCSTMHAGQGITKEAFGMVMTGSQMENKHLGYVGVSRHEGTLALFATSSADERIAESFTRSAKARALEADMRDWAKAAREGDADAMSRLEKACDAARLQEQVKRAALKGLEKEHKEAEAKSAKADAAVKAAYRSVGKDGAKDAAADARFERRQADEIKGAREAATRSLSYAVAGLVALESALNAAKEAARIKIEDGRKPILVKNPAAVATESAMAKAAKQKSPPLEESLNDIINHADKRLGRDRSIGHPSGLGFGGGAGGHGSGQTPQIYAGPQPHAKGFSRLQEMLARPMDAARSLARSLLHKNPPDNVVGEHRDDALRRSDRLGEAGAGFGGPVGVDAGSAGSRAVGSPGADGLNVKQETSAASIDAAVSGFPLGTWVAAAPPAAATTAPAATAAGRDARRTPSTTIEPNANLAGKGGGGATVPPATDRPRETAAGPQTPATVGGMRAADSRRTPAEAQGKSEPGAPTPRPAATVAEASQPGRAQPNQEQRRAAAAKTILEKLDQAALDSRQGLDACEYGRLRARIGGDAARDAALTLYGPVSKGDGARAIRSAADVFTDPTLMGASDLALAGPKAGRRAVEGDIVLRDTTHAYVLVQRGLRTGLIELALDAVRGVRPGLRHLSLTVGADGTVEKHEPPNAIAKVYSPDPDALAEALKTPGAAAETDALGRTALHHAVARGNATQAATLLAAGADPDAQVCGMTPLHMAPFGKAGDAVKAVFREHAEATERRAAEERALREAEAAMREKEARAAQISAMFDAAIATRNDGYIFEALDLGANPDGALDGEPLLIRAAKSGNLELAEALLIRGAKPGACDADGRTALHHAARSGRRELASMLAEAGANPNARDDLGQTPLHAAALLAKQTGDRSMYNALVSARANPNAQDKSGLTPQAIQAVRSPLAPKSKTEIAFVPK